MPYAKVWSGLVAKATKFFFYWLKLTIFSPVLHNHPEYEAKSRVEAKKPADEIEFDASKHSPIFFGQEFKLLKIDDENLLVNTQIILVLIF